MSLAHFRMLIHNFFYKDTYIFPEEGPLVILDSNYNACMANTFKDANHTRHIDRRVNFVRNGENLQNAQY